MPDDLRPVGQKHPCGVFLGRGSAGPPAPTKTRYFSRSISFLFYINIIISHAGGFEQPVPDDLRPVGQKHPCGVFLGRGSAGPPAPTKTRYFSRSISFLFYIKHYNKPRWWIRTARVRRFASCRAKTPLRGVFRVRLGGFTKTAPNHSVTVTSTGSSASSIAFSWVCG